MVDCDGRRDGWSNTPRPKLHPLALASPSGYDGRVLSETQGCDILFRLFTKRGYKIARNVPFEEGGVSFNVDGWDAEARVGFEFLSHESNDHMDISAAELDEIVRRNHDNELHIFLVNQAGIFDEAELERIASKFLDTVARITAK